MTTPTLTLNKFLPAVFSVLLVLFGSLFFFLKGENKTLSVKFFIIYSVVTALLFALIALEALVDFESPMGWYYGSMTAFGCLGILHTWVIRNNMGLEENESFLPEFIFTIYVTMLGAVVFSFLFGYLNNHAHLRYTHVFCTAIITAFIPFLFYRAFIYLMAIPAPVFKKWYYPVGEEVFIAEEEFADDRIRVLKIEVANSPSNPDKIQKSKFRGGIRVEVGKMVAFWMSYWNETDPGNTIEVEDEYGQAYGWNFYVKPKWYEGQRFLDPDLTIAENDLKDGDIIIAERVLD